MSTKAKTQLLTFGIAVLWMGVRAFSVPWVWNLYQCVLVFLGVCLALALASWGFRWAKFGTQDVGEQWNSLWEKVGTVQTHKPTRTRNLAIWIVVALALVFYFNWKQTH
jgi:hypothetical protein